jgi:hypothetical protein
MSFFAFSFGITAALAALPVALPLSVISLIAEDGWSKWPKLFRAALIFTAIQSFAFCGGATVGMLVDTSVPSILKSYIA